MIDRFQVSMESMNENEKDQLLANLWAEFKIKMETPDIRCVTRWKLVCATHVELRYIYASR